LKCLRRFLKQDGINLKGIEKLIKFVPCYEISPCDGCCHCTAYLKRSIPTVGVGGQSFESWQAKAPSKSEA
jgi:hypothetical protein